MAHQCSYFSEVTLHGDEIVNEVTALYCPKKGKPLKELVYEEHEDGTNCCRYLYRGSFCTMRFPLASGRELTVPLRFIL